MAKIKGFEALTSLKLPQQQTDRVMVDALISTFETLKSEGLIEQFKVEDLGKLIDIKVWR